MLLGEEKEKCFASYFLVCLQKAKSNILTAESIYILKYKPKMARIYGPCYSRRKKKLHIIKHLMALMGLTLDEIIRPQ